MVCVPEKVMYTVCMWNKYNRAIITVIILIGYSLQF